MLQHGDGLLVRRRVARNCQAAQVQVISLLVIGTRSRFAENVSSSKSGNQSLTDGRGNSFAHGEGVVGRDLKLVSPDGAI